MAPGFLFVLFLFAPFLLYENPPLPCSYASFSTCHLQQHSQTSLDSYLAPLPHFCKNTKRARIFDTTYFYMSYSCKNDTKHKTYIRGTADVFVYMFSGKNPEGIKGVIPPNYSLKRLSEKRPGGKCFVNIVVGAPSLLCSRF